MPELPEVETVRRAIEAALLGQQIVAAEVAPDEIVLQGCPHEVVETALQGQIVSRVGRRGKHFWIELDQGPVVYGHLGMAGWVRRLGHPTIRLLEHGNAPMDDESGRPRFLKMLIEAKNGERIAMTDGRRLARIWVGGIPAEEPKLKSLGPDMLTEPWDSFSLKSALAKRSGPIKSVLLDQAVFCGVGNWIADEVLYQSHIHPQRAANSLSLAELERLTQKMLVIIETAVNVGADMHQYPADWLFHARWGGSKGTTLHNGVELQRGPVGGRTTVWAPELQK